MRREKRGGAASKDNKRSLLIIFDNVDEFLLRHQRAFSMNVQYL